MLIHPLIQSSFLCADCEVDGYSKFGDSCYKFFSAGQSGIDAQEICEGDQGSLVSISSEAENEHVKGLFRYVCLADIATA